MEERDARGRIPREEKPTRELVGKTALKILLYKTGRAREIQQVSDTCVEAMNDELHYKLQEVIKNAILLCEYRRKKRISLEDVIEGAKLAGMGNFYGFAKGISDSPIKCSTQNKVSRKYMKSVKSRLETKIKKYGEEAGCVDINMSVLRNASVYYTDPKYFDNYGQGSVNKYKKISTHSFTADAMHMLGFLMQIHMNRLFSAACILCIARSGVRVFGRDIKNSIAICETVRGRM